MFIIRSELQNPERKYLKYRKVSESHVNSEWQIIISRISRSQWICAQLRGLRRAALCLKVPRTLQRRCRLREHSSQCLRMNISWSFYRDMNADSKIPNTKSNVVNTNDLQRLESSLQELLQAIFQLHKCQLIFWLNHSLHKQRFKSTQDQWWITYLATKYNKQSSEQLSFVSDKGLRTWEASSNVMKPSQVLNEYDHPSQNSRARANKTKSTLSPA